MSMTTLTLVKLSFLIFYKRVFVYDKGNLSDIRNLLLNAMIVIIVLWDLGFSITMFASCRDDFNARFSPKTPAEIAGQCIDTFALLYGYAISDFITDCIIILTPIPFIWRLHLPLGRKLGVALVFLMGTL
jgi:hypothetical protein